MQCDGLLLAYLDWQDAERHLADLDQQALRSDNSGRNIEKLQSKMERYKVVTDQERNELGNRFSK